MEIRKEISEEALNGLKEQVRDLTILFKKNRRMWFSEKGVNKRVHNNMMRVYAKKLTDMEEIFMKQTGSVNGFYEAYNSVED